MGASNRDLQVVTKVEGFSSEEVELKHYKAVIISCALSPWRRMDIEYRAGRLLSHSIVLRCYAKKLSKEADLQGRYAVRSDVSRACRSAAF